MNFHEFLPIFTISFYYFLSSTEYFEYEKDMKEEKFYHRSSLHLLLGPLMILLSLDSNFSNPYQNTESYIIVSIDINYNIVVVYSGQRRCTQLGSFLDN